MELSALSAGALGTPVLTRTVQDALTLRSPCLLLWREINSQDSLNEQLIQLTKCIV